MELILKYFPNLTDTQRTQFAALKALYEDWNSKINVISRKDMDNFYEHHVLHSLRWLKLSALTTSLPNSFRARKRRRSTTSW